MYVLLYKMSHVVMWLGKLVLDHLRDENTGIMAISCFSVPNSLIISFFDPGGDLSSDKKWNWLSMPPPAASIHRQGLVIISSPCAHSYLCLHTTEKIKFSKSKVLKLCVVVLLSYISYQVDPSRIPGVVGWMLLPDHYCLFLLNGAAAVGLDRQHWSRC